MNSETYQRDDGYTIILHHDEDCSNPRESDMSFLWLGFPHRHYTLGDETIDPEGSFPCPACKGTGGITGFADDGDICPFCDGAGERVPETWDQLFAVIEAVYGKARMIRKVGMIDHSGVSFYLGGGAHWSDSAGWDSGTCGVMVALESRLEEWGLPLDTPDDELERQMRAELEEYTAWAAGDCWGFEVQRTDEFQPVPGVDFRTALTSTLEVGTCWGFVGQEAALAEAEMVIECDRKVVARG